MHLERGYQFHSKEAKLCVIYLLMQAFWSWAEGRPQLKKNISITHFHKHVAG